MRLTPLARRTARTSRGPRHAARLAAALAVAGAAFTFSAPPAAAAEAVWEGYGPFLEIDTVVGGTAWPGVESGIMQLRIDGTLYAGYCIEFFNDRLVEGSTYVDTEWASTEASTAMPRVNWILSNSYPQRSLAALSATVGSPLTAAQAAAGTQAAIWAFTEPGFGLAPTNDAAVLALFAHLTGPANVGIATEPPGSELTVSPVTASGTAGSLIGPFSVTTTAETVTVTAAAPATVVNAAGTPISTVAAGGSFFVRVPSGTAPGSVGVSVSGEARIESGRVFFTPDVEPHLQDQVLAEAAVETLEVAVSASWTASVTTTSTSTTSTSTTSTSTTSTSTTSTTLFSTSVATTSTTGATTTTPTTAPGTTVTTGSTTTFQITSTLPPTTANSPTSVARTLPETGGGEEYRSTLLLTLALLGGGAALVGVEVAAGEVARRRRRTH